MQLANGSCSYVCQSWSLKPTLQGLQGPVIWNASLGPTFSSSMCWNLWKFCECQSAWKENENRVFFFTWGLCLRAPFDIPVPSIQIQIPQISETSDAKSIPRVREGANDEVGTLQHGTLQISSAHFLLSSSKIKALLAMEVSLQFHPGIPPSIPQKDHLSSKSTWSESSLDFTKLSKCVSKPSFALASTRMRCFTLSSTTQKLAPINLQTEIGSCWNWEGFRMCLPMHL